MSVVILLVDDEETIRYSLKRLLSKMGHRVVAAASGEEALACLEKEHFDLLIADIKLPGIGGLEVLSRFKARLPKAKAIIFTGIPSYESATQAVKLGASAYLAKPFEMQAMEKAIERSLMDEAKRQDIYKNKLVLIVEDDRSYLTLLKEFCALKGIGVLGVADASEAWQELQSGKPFDLALMDILLPGSSGIELCQKVKSDPSLKHIPVVLMTGSKNVIAFDPEKEAKKAGADFFFCKPADPFEVGFYLERFL